jgi:hypothetical protein
MSCGRLITSILSPLSHSKARLTSNSTYSEALDPDANASLPIVLATDSITLTSLEGSKFLK